MVGIGKEVVRCSDSLVLARYSSIEGENGRSGSSVNYLEKDTTRMLLKTSSATPRIGTRFLLEDIHATLKGPIFTVESHLWLHRITRHKKQYRPAVHIEYASYIL